MLIVKRRAVASHREACYRRVVTRIGKDQVASCIEQGSNRAIVGFVLSTETSDADQRLGDVSGQANWLNQLVVRSLSTSDGKSCHRHGLATPRIGICKAATSTTGIQRNRIRSKHATQDTRQRRHRVAVGVHCQINQRRVSRTVVSPILCANSTNSERCRVDLGSKTCRLLQLVVQGVRAADGVASHGYVFGDNRSSAITRDIRIGKTRHRNPAKCDRVATQRRNRSCATQGRTAGSVVGLVVSSQTGYRQCRLVDGRRESGRLNDVVVAGKTGAVTQGQARHRDNLIGTGIFVGELGCCASAQQRQGLTCHAGNGSSAAKRGRGECIIGFIGNDCPGHHDIFGSNRAADTAITVGKYVVGSAGTRYAQITATHRQGFSSADILGVKGIGGCASKGNGDIIPIDHIGQRHGRAHQVAIGVIHLAASDAHGEFALADCCGTAHHRAGAESVVSCCRPA